MSSVLAVSVVSLTGAIALAWQPERARRVAERLVAFAVGALYGDAFIHLIPESFARFPQADLVPALCVLAGVISFFTVERLLRRPDLHHRWHHLRPMVAVNLIGDGLHNAIDGMLIGAAYLAGPELGITTTVAVLLHEIPQELSDFAVLVRGGLSVRRAVFYNFLSALGAVAGACLALAIGAAASGLSSILLPVTAGGLIYLAGADLIPELQHQKGTSALLRDVALIAAGVLVMVALRAVE